MTHVTEQTAASTPVAAPATTVATRPKRPDRGHSSGATAMRPSTLRRLRDPLPDDGPLSWLVTLAITALAFFLRFVGIGKPAYIVFDETYYAKDAWSLLQSGYERNWTASANQEIAAGRFSDALLKPDAEFVVHPPLGKWLIAGGEQLFGMNSFGWRFSALVFGSLLVMAVIRLARRLSRSTLIGAIAGLLITFDGLSFVLSRIALLDIFEATFIVAGVACMVADRDWFRNRLADDLDRRGLRDLGGAFGPVVVFRPWRLAAGVLFGLAVGVKWNAMFVLAAMCVLSLLWDVSARRLAGADARRWWGLLADGIPAFVHQVVVALGVYIATWSGWLTTHGGWDRDWSVSHPDAWQTKLLGGPLGSLLYYHQEVWNFHNGDYMKHQTHVYSAHPAGWLVMARTIGIDAVNDVKPGTQGCPPGGDQCLSVITGLGTPLLWWLAFAALFAGLLWWLGGRDWRFSVPIVAALATYLPWFNYAQRPEFFFYAITIIPFTAINLALVMGKILGPGRRRGRRQIGAIVVGTALALIIANFAFIYPILTDQMMPRWQWMLRMWLQGWI